MQQQNQANNEQNATFSAALIENEEGYHITRFVTEEQALFILRVLSKMPNQKTVFLDPGIPNDILNQLMMALGEAPHNLITVARLSSKNFGETTTNPLPNNNATFQNVSLISGRPLIVHNSNTANIHLVGTPSAALITAIQATVNPPPAPVPAPVPPVQPQVQVPAPVQVQTPTPTVRRTPAPRSIFEEENTSRRRHTSVSRTTSIRSPLRESNPSQGILALLQAQTAQRRLFNSESSSHTTTTSQKPAPARMEPEEPRRPNLVAPRGRGSDQIGPVDIDSSNPVPGDRSIIKARRKFTSKTNPSSLFSTTTTTTPQPIPTGSSSNEGQSIAKRTRTGTLREVAENLNPDDYAAVAGLLNLKLG